MHKVPISDIKALLDNHEIEDAKTIIGLQYILLNYNHSNYAVNLLHLIENIGSLVIEIFSI